jgi:hypothetical protein
MKKRVLSKESLFLVALCVLDLIYTVYLLQKGVALESNPLLAAYLPLGLLPFCLVKLAFTVLPVAGLELLARRNPISILRIERAGIVAYIGFYLAALFCLNG